MKKLKITAISDLHGNLPLIEDGHDILIIAGDIMPLEIQFKKIESKLWLESEFTYWINNLPVDKVFLVAGNHDAYLENIGKTNLLTLIEICNNKLIYMENETVEYIDKNKFKWNIFGTPYCHIFGNWPFMRSEEYMEDKFKLLPVVITYWPVAAL